MNAAALRPLPLARIDALELRRPCGPPLPCATHRLPALRSSVVDRKRGDGAARAARAPGERRHRACEASGPRRLPDAVAPGLSTLGFMLPYTPLHWLLLQDVDRPIVLTSGNGAEAPQCIDNADARTRWGPSPTAS